MNKKAFRNWDPFLFFLVLMAPSLLVDWVVRILFFLPRFRGHKWEIMGIRE